MYVRLLRLSLRPGALPAFEALYDSRIFPTLSGIEGCRGAALLSQARRDEEVVSMTVWRDRAVADAYDREGRFARLLNEAERLMPDAAEDPDSPEDDDVSVEGFGAELLVAPDLAAALVPGTFARTLSVRVAPDRVRDFDLRYRAEVASAHEDFPELFAVFLLHGAVHREATLGLSLWRGEEAAARYDLSGRFDELARDIKETLSAVTRWRAAFVSGGEGGEGVPGLAVGVYRVRAARAF